VSLKIGPFIVKLISPLPWVFSGLSLLYRDYQRVAVDQPADFNIELRSPTLLRSYLRPQVNFFLDGHSPFKPLPRDQAFAMFEWGLNWCVANYAHQYLNIHAAVVERDGKALVLPGVPGSGKSTLCAALVSQGWRLLSDEMTLVDTDIGMITPIPRPIGLKNQSIDIIQALSEEIVISEPVHDTAKGSVAHMLPPQQSVADATRGASPALIVFPTYSAKGEACLQSLSKGQTLLRMADNSFNYNILGSLGFDALASLVDRSRCFSFSYPSLEVALDEINGLWDAR